MGRGKSVPRVSSGVPWWLWAMAVLVTVGVVIGIVASIDDKTLDDVFAEAVEAAQERDRTAFEAVMQDLRARGLDGDRLAVLEGVHSAATVRLPRAVEQLKPYLDHEDEQLRDLAIRHSAVAHHSMGDIETAQQLYRKSIELDPDDVLSMERLLQVYESVKSIGLIEQTARDILAVEPENRAAEEKLVTVIGESGRLEEAIAAADQMLASASDRAVATPDVVDKYMGWLMDSGQLDQAEAFVDENPTLVGRFTKLECLVITGRLDEADEIFSVLPAAEDHPLHLRHLAAQAMEAGEPERAVELLLKAVPKVPRKRRVFTELETAAVQCGKSELVTACRENLEAIEAIQRQMYEAVSAVGDDLADPQLRLKVAVATADLGDPVSARTWLNAGIAVASASDKDREELRQRLPELLKPKGLLIPLPGTDTDEESADEEPTEESGDEEESSADTDASDEESASEPSETAPEEPPAEPAPEESEEATESSDTPESDSDSSDEGADSAPAEE